MGLIRPEGVFLGALMLASIVYMRGIENSGRLVISFAGLFTTLGLSYFLWHWAYFGYCLPNAFYVKGGGHFHYTGLHDSVRNVLDLCLPFLVVLVFGWFSAPRTRRESVFALIPIAGFTLLWGLLSSRMDFYARFQYAALPIVLLSWPVVLRLAWRYWEMPCFARWPTERRRKAAAFLAVMAAGVLGFQLRAYRVGLPRDFHYDVGLILREYRNKGYTLVTTEAGLVPLISEWRTVDAWGLNDRTLAHRASIDEAYLDAHPPQVIEVHEESSPGSTPDDASEDRRWTATVTALESYVQRRGYKLAAVAGSRQDAFCFYVQPGFADGDQIAVRLRELLSPESPAP
jgi:hypothetical protein